MKNKRNRRGGEGGRAQRKVSKKEVAAVEHFRVNVQFAIQRLMMDRSISQSALAKKLGMTQPRVSQFFAPTCNLTIRNLARIFYALGDECFVWSAGLEQLAAEGKAPKSPIAHLTPKLRVFCDYDSAAAAPGLPPQYRVSFKVDLEAGAELERFQYAQLGRFDEEPRSPLSLSVPPPPLAS